MSWATLERAIVTAARIALKNPKLKKSDLCEWSTCEVKPADGEVALRLPNPGVWIAVLKTCDKREPAPTANKTGWGFTKLSKSKLHYFVDGRSLCHGTAPYGPVDDIKLVSDRACDICDAKRQAIENRKPKVENPGGSATRGS